MWVHPPAQALSHHGQASSKDQYHRQWPKGTGSQRGLRSRLRGYTPLTLLRQWQLELFTASCITGMSTVRAYTACGTSDTSHTNTSGRELTLACFVILLNSGGFGGHVQEGSVQFQT